MVLTLSSLGIASLLSFGNSSGSESFFHINFKSITPVNWVETVIATTVVVTAYICITYIIEVFKGEHLEDNKSKKEKENPDVNY